MNLKQAIEKWEHENNRFFADHTKKAIIEIAKKWALEIVEENEKGNNEKDLVVQMVIDFTNMTLDNIRQQIKESD